CSKSGLTRHNTSPFFTTCPSRTFNSIISPETSELNFTSNSGCTFPLADTNSEIVRSLTSSTATCCTPPSPNQPSLLPITPSIKISTAEMTIILGRLLFFFAMKIYLKSYRVTDIIINDFSAKYHFVFATDHFKFCFVHIRLCGKHFHRIGYADIITFFDRLVSDFRGIESYLRREIWLIR